MRDRKYFRNQYKKFMKLEPHKRILIFMGIALILRLIFVRTPIMELDINFFARQARGFQTAFMTGKIFSQPFTHEYYYGIEYRSPLMALLGGIFSLIIRNVEYSLIAVSMVAGVLLVIPVYLLAQRLWGEPAGDIAALLIVINPLLIRASTMGLSESLYTTIFMAAVYYTIKSYERGEWKDILLTGVFWGLAYQTRFEGLAGAGLSGLIILYRLFDKQVREKRSLTLKKAGAYGLVVFLIMSPYLLILSKSTGGGFHLTSPSKQIYDLSEGLFITKAETGGYDRYTYLYGDPGESSYDTLHKMFRKTGPQLYNDNFNHIMRQTMQAIPNNIWVARSNVHNIFFLFLLIPILARWKSKDPRLTVLAIMYLLIVPAILFQFWAPSSRYFLVLIPLIMLNISGILKNLLLKNEAPLSETPLKKHLFSWVLIPLALFTSWYFSLAVPFDGDFMQINPSHMVRIFHIFLGPLIVMLLTAGVLAVLLSLVWRRIFPFFTVTSIGFGLLVLYGAFGEAQKETPGRAVDLFTSAWNMPGFSLIMWIVCLGLFLEAVYYVHRRYKSAIDFQRAMVILSIIGFALISLQNLTAMLHSQKQFRQYHYHPIAVKMIKEREKGNKNLVVMCRHPRDAFVLNAKWKKVPYVAAVNEMRQGIRDSNADYIITDSNNERHTPSGNLYSMLLTLAEEKEIVRLWEGKKKELIKGAPGAVTRLFFIPDNKKKPEGETLPPPPK